MGSLTTGAAWLVLPTYNEAENLEELVRMTLPILEACAPGGCRVLIVDDGSPDGTGAIADALAAELDAVEVLHRTSKDGLGRAYVAGFAHALARGAGMVIEMDADFSHRPEHLPDLVAAVAAGSDLALGSRYVPGGGVVNWGVLRRLLSRAGCWYARTVLGVPIRDLTGGFKCFSARALRALDAPSARAQGYGFQVELTYRAVRAGLRVVEVPIVFHERVRGRSKMTARIALEAAWLVPQLRWPRGARRAHRLMPETSTGGSRGS